MEKGESFEGRICGEFSLSTITLIISLRKAACHTTQPQEEIRAFATRANQTVKKGIPGLAPVGAPPAKTSGTKAKKSTQPPSQPLPAKNKGAIDGEVSITDGLSNLNVSSSAGQKKADAASSVSSVATTAAPTVTAPVDPKVEAAKKIKGLKKKLRDIEEIAQKKPEDLTPEQAEKLGRKDEIEAEIARLSLI